MGSEPSLEALLVELKSGDEGRAEAAAVQLAAFGQRALPVLEPLLSSAEVDDRWWAVRTLGQMAEPRTDWLLPALRDGSSEVRAAAALALVSHPMKEAAPELVHALGDEDSVVAILAVNALTVIGPDAVPPLLEAFPTASQRGRIQMMRALAELRDHRAIPAMLKATEDDSAMLRYWANEAIERLGLNMVYIKPE